MDFKLKTKSNDLFQDFNSRSTIYKLKLWKKNTKSQAGFLDYSLGKIGISFFYRYDGDNLS
jgi:hypothetical protein